jgi:hypothetical protein
MAPPLASSLNDRLTASGEIPKYARRARRRQIYLFSNFPLRTLQGFKKLYKQSNFGNCAMFTQQESMMLSLTQIVAKFANDLKVQPCILPQPWF